MTYVPKNNLPQASTIVDKAAPAPHVASHRMHLVRWLLAGLIFGACIAGATLFGGWTYVNNWLTQYGI